MSDSQKPNPSSESDPTPPKPLPSTMRTREPWPMWPIGLAIVLFIGVYTWVNLNFRKEGHAYEPFQAMMDRKNAIVEKNFYDWYSLKTSRAAETKIPQSPATATSQAYENVLDEVIPEQLKYYMPGRPILVPGFVKSESPDSLTPGKPLPVTLHVPAHLQNDDRLQLLAFYKEGQMFLLATLFVEKRDEIDFSQSASDTAAVTFEVPTEPIAAETIQVSFLTDDRLAEWSIQNLDPSAAVVEETEETAE